MKDDYTVSELLFEELCKKHSIPCEPVPTSTNKSPDYEVVISGQKIIVEVKQIDPNVDEVKQIEQLSRENRTHGGGTPGDRMRKVIASANGQLKCLSQGKFPTLLIVYNNVPHACHTDPYFILVAMYGFQNVNLAINSSTHEIRTIGSSFGGKRKMTPYSNTSTSAIGVISKDRFDNVDLSVFHNMHAAVTLNPFVLSQFHFNQYQISKDTGNQFCMWENIT